MNNTEAKPTTAQLVADYRAQIAADPELYDGDLDVASWFLADTRRAVTPSELGKALRIGTHEAAELLAQLVELGEVVGDDRGAWTRYSTTR